LSTTGEDSYAGALAAYRWGVDLVRQAGVPRATESLDRFIQQVNAYAEFYAADPRLNPNAPPAQSGPTTAATPTTGTTPSSGSTGEAANGWRLTWSDEFNGAAGTAPDPAKWGHETGGGGWGNSELQYYTSSTANAAHDGGGNLTITARTDGAAANTCWYGACRYTSARLSTAGKFTQAYGRISARMKLPRGQGLWPSFLGFGENIGSVGWRNAGELNVAAGHGNTPATVEGGLIGPGYSKFATTTMNGGTFADDFHTFAADWYPDHVSFLVDGRVYASQYRTPAGAGWVFDHPFFLVLDVAVGGNQPGNPDASTTFPQRLLVDWVRVYQAGEPTTSTTGQLTGNAGQQRGQCHPNQRLFGQCRAELDLRHRRRRTVSRQMHGRRGWRDGERREGPAGRLRRADRTDVAPADQRTVAAHAVRPVPRHHGQAHGKWHTAAALGLLGRVQPDLETDLTDPE